MDIIPQVSDSRCNKHMSAVKLLLCLAAAILTACGDNSTGPGAGQPDSQKNDAPAAAVMISEEGAKLFKLKCGTCHTVEPGKPSPVGPSLAGLMDRPAASVQGFAYSKAMKSYSEPWNRMTLDAFIANPSATVPGNRMAFAGVSESDQRELIIEYIVAHK